MRFNVQAQNINFAAAASPEEEQASPPTGLNALRRFRPRGGAASPKRRKGARRAQPQQQQMSPMEIAARVQPQDPIQRVRQEGQRVAAINNRVSAILRNSIAERGYLALTSLPRNQSIDQRALFDALSANANLIADPEKMAIFNGINNQVKASVEQRRAYGINKGPRASAYNAQGVLARRERNPFNLRSSLDTKFSAAFRYSGITQGSTATITNRVNPNRLTVGDNVGINNIKRNSIVYSPKEANGSGAGGYDVHISTSKIYKGIQADTSAETAVYFSTTGTSVGEAPVGSSRSNIASKIVRFLERCDYKSSAATLAVTNRAHVLRLPVPIGSTILTYPSKNTLVQKNNDTAYGSSRDGSPVRYLSYVRQDMTYSGAQSLLEIAAQRAKAKPLFGTDTIPNPDNPATITPITFSQIRRFAKDLGTSSNITLGSLPASVRNDVNAVMDNRPRRRGLYDQITRNRPQSHRLRGDFTIPFSSYAMLKNRHLNTRIATAVNASGITVGFSRDSDYAPTDLLPMQYFNTGSKLVSAMGSIPNLKGNAEDVLMPSGSGTTSVPYGQMVNVALSTSNSKYLFVKMPKYQNGSVVGNEGTELYDIEDASIFDRQTFIYQLTHSTPNAVVLSTKIQELPNASTVNVSAWMQYSSEWLSSINQRLSSNSVRQEAKSNLRKARGIWNYFRNPEGRLVAGRIADTDVFYQNTSDITFNDGRGFGGGNVVSFDNQRFVDRVPLEKASSSILELAATPFIRRVIPITTLPLVYKGQTRSASANEIQTGDYSENFKVAPFCMFVADKVNYLQGNINDVFSPRRQIGDPTTFSTSYARKQKAVTTGNWINYGALTTNSVGGFDISYWTADLQRKAANVQKAYTDTVFKNSPVQFYNMVDVCGEFNLIQKAIVPPENANFGRVKGVVKHCVKAVGGSNLAVAIDLNNVVNPQASTRRQLQEAAAYYTRMIRLCESKISAIYANNSVNNVTIPQTKQPALICLEFAYQRFHALVTSLTQALYVKDANFKASLERIERVDDAIKYILESVFSYLNISYNNNIEQKAKSILGYDLSALETFIEVNGISQNDRREIEAEIQDCINSRQSAPAAVIDFLTLSRDMTNEVAAHEIWCNASPEEKQRLRDDAQDFVGGINSAALADAVSDILPRSIVGINASINDIIRRGVAGVNLQGALNAIAEGSADVAAPDIFDIPVGAINRRERPAAPDAPTPPRDRGEPVSAAEVNDLLDAFGALAPAPAPDDRAEFVPPILVPDLPTPITPPAPEPTIEQAEVQKKRRGTVAKVAAGAGAAGLLYYLITRR